MSTARSRARALELLRKSVVLRPVESALEGTLEVAESEQVVAVVAEVGEKEELVVVDEIAREAIRVSHVCEVLAQPGQRGWL